MRPPEGPDELGTLTALVERLFPKLVALHKATGEKGAYKKTGRYKFFVTGGDSWINLQIDLYPENADAFSQEFLHSLSDGMMGRDSRRLNLNLNRFPGGIQVIYDVTKGEHKICWKSTNSVPPPSGSDVSPRFEEVRDVLTNLERLLDEEAETPSAVLRLLNGFRKNFTSWFYGNT